MDVAAILSQCGLFASLDSRAISQLATLCSHHPVAGGERLFAAGGAADCLYIVASGRLRALRPDGSVAGDISRLEPIGEISVMTDEPRSGEVYALRDSLLLRIEREALLAFISRHPATLLEITRVLIHRLRQNLRPTSGFVPQSRPALAIMPAGPSVPMAGFLDRLDAAFRRHGEAPERLDAARIDEALGEGAAQLPLTGGDGDERLIQWLAEREHAGQRLLYIGRDGGNGGGDAWSERCMRQADRVLIVTDTRTRPIDSPLPALLRRLQLRTPVELVMLREGAGTAPVSMLRDWTANCDLDAHHHLHPLRAADHDRLARLLSGRALGLVLGGGGARGFAHIGLIRALEEMSLPVDLIGGTSMGAFFGALLACGADSRELRRVAMETFVQQNYLNDYVLPRVSLIRGRRFSTRLRAIFGEQMIEELPLSYFCVSTNLTRGNTMIHRQGPLSLWVGTSMAVPGVAPPVVWNGDLLVDGAIANSLPTDIMQADGRGPIIASDVSTEGGLSLPGVDGPDPEALLKQRRDVAGLRLADILFRSATLTSESGTKARAARADLYLRMPVSGIGLFDWKRIDELIERGYRHALRGLEGFVPGARRDA